MIDWRWAWASFDNTSVANVFPTLCSVINDVPQSTAFSFWLEYAHMMYDVEYLTTSTGRAAVQPACESMTRLPCTCIPADVYTRSVSINIYRKTIELTSRFLSILHHILSISFFSFLFFLNKQTTMKLAKDDDDVTIQRRRRTCSAFLISASNCSLPKCLYYNRTVNRFASPPRWLENCWRESWEEEIIVTIIIIIIIITQMDRTD